MSSKKKHSFTIIELAIIATTVAMFAGIAIAYFDSVTVYSRDSKRKTDIDAIRKALLVQSSMGSKMYPIQNNWCCIGAEGTDKCSNLESALNGYISKMPRDPSYAAGSMANCYMYKTNSKGDAFSLYTSLEEGGILMYTNNTKALRDPKIRTDDCGNKPGEDEWVSGPGFCVMKYEARKSSGSDCRDVAGNLVPCPVSKPTAEIWNNASFEEADYACRSVGAHLISNAEWMAIAHDIEKNDANWIDGRSSGSLKRGNIGTTALKGGYNLGGIDFGSGESLSEFKLTNGDSIFHFSGNLGEWVDYRDFFTVNPVGSWVDYPAADITSFGKVSYFNIGPKDKTYGDMKGVGKVRTASGGQYFVRGGNYQDTNAAGIYALDLLSSSELSSLIGFRCAK